MVCRLVHFCRAHRQTCRRQKVQHLLQCMWCSLKVTLHLEHIAWYIKKSLLFVNMYVCFLCLDCFTVCFCVFCASILFLCTDSLSSCLIFVSSLWASLPEIKRWNICFFSRYTFSAFLFRILVSFNYTYILYGCVLSVSYVVLRWWWWWWWWWWYEMGCTHKTSTLLLTLPT